LCPSTLSLDKLGMTALWVVGCDPLAPDCRVALAMTWGEEV